MKRLTTIITAVVLLFSTTMTAYGAEAINCWFPAGWKSKGQQAKAITDALSAKSGLNIKPRIAKNYPQILKAFSSNQQSLVYVGSFVQAIINARGLGTALVQNINGKDLYSGILVFPKGQNPEDILKNTPEKIAYTVGASSGESSAKAATSGKCAIGVANHGAAAGAVKAGKAKAAVVKNWWWAGNAKKFSELDSYLIPGVSESKNPDNVLTASKSMSQDNMQKITKAAIASKDVFNAPEMTAFDKSRLQFPLELMKKGGIDPLTYSWN